MGSAASLRLALSMAHVGTYALQMMTCTGVWGVSCCAPLGCACLSLGCPAVPMLRPRPATTSGDDRTLCWW